MNTSSIASTPSLAAQTSYSLSVRASSGPPRSEGSDETSKVHRARHEGHEHHRHHDRADSQSDRQDSGAAFTTLKLKIQETFSSLTGSGRRSDDDDESSTAASGFEGEFKASIQFSGPGGEFKAKLKFSLDGDSANGGTDFASALQGFAQTLFAALNTLYGGSPSPTTPTLPAPAGSVAAGATPPTPSLTNTATTALPAGSTAQADATPPADSAPVVTEPTSATSPLVTSNASRASASISIKLRATYDSFENNLGPLVNQLAQPNVSDAFPALASLLSDLTERFGQLVSQTSAANASAPSLKDFLTALSGSFFGPQSGAATDPAKADASTPAASAAAAGAQPTVTDAVVADAPQAANTAPQRYTATAQYKQMLTYTDAASSFSLQSSLSARMVYAVA
ncbi:MAG: hypothetical protein Q7T97_09555 [Burkholderiaceae bacterium]|nr:hypothetical protein [Burkholderiaceae bacterium]